MAQIAIAVTVDADDEALAEQLAERILAVLARALREPTVSGSDTDLHSISIGELGLQRRVYYLLRRLGVDSIGQLVENSEHSLLCMERFGKRSLADVKAKLEEHGLSLK